MTCTLTRNSKFFRIFFLYLSLFLVTPWYDFSKNKIYRSYWCKVYRYILILIKLTFIILLLTDGVQVLLGRMVLLSQKIIYISILCISILLTTITIMKTCFLECSNWRRLLMNCQYIDKKISRENSNLFWKIVWMKFIFFVLTAYELYIWLMIFDFSVIKFLPVLSYMRYYKFMVTTLAEILIGKIRSGYVNLNRNLVKSYHSPNFLHEMRALTRDYRILGETIDTYNNLFGYQIILIMLHCGLEVISNLNFSLGSIIMMNSGNPLLYNLFVCSSTLLMFSLYNFVTIVLKADATTQEAQKFLDLCYKIQDQFKMDSKEIDVMAKLISYSKRFFREFSACGYFKINKTNIFSLIGNVTAYLIIAMQFNENHLRKIGD
ncbi:hypothetical protein Zmor_019785 [Zophobas morio]|uniref:Gustatory receptor n=1 Tax=Zophobas morio TaxID=2755281 RepID=A0AA38I2C7_9CUCU|nr:hypothetical protein Zmor_019785 [Zophobas morio]